MMKPRISLAKKLLVMVLTTSAVLSTILTVCQIIFEYQEKKSQLDAVIAGIESTLLPSLAQRMWDYDEATIRDQLHSVLVSSDVANIELINDKGKVVYKDGHEGFVPRYPVPKEFSVTHRKDSSDVVVGHLKMTFYADKLLAEVQFHFITLLCFNMLKTLIVALILSYLFQKSVARPLTEIVAYFAAQERLSADAPRPTLQIRRNTARDDEITDLISYINSHDQLLFKLQAEQHAKIKVQEKALEDSDAALKQERARGEMNARMAQLAEMASGIAHEINNPLTIIEGFLHVAHSEVKKAQPNIERVESMLEKSMVTVTRIAKIITGLRTYARDGNGDPLEMSSVRGIVDDTLGLVSSRLTSNDVDLRVDFTCNEASSFSCRKVQITQILVALINNAYDAIKTEKSPWIRLKVDMTEDAACFSVSDSGSGIPPEIAAKIFDPFFTTKQVGTGSGLGLSVALGLARGLGGELNLVSGAGNTTFELRLPVTANKSNQDKAA